MEETTLDASGLTKIYARYFIEDFRDQVLNHVRGNFMIDAELLNTLVPVEDVAAVSQDNSVTRFIHENAVHAIEEGIVNPESREVYDHLKTLPSSYEEDVSQLVYTTAMFYNQAIQHTLINTVGTDALSAMTAITAAINARHSNTETGGILKYFNWGILSDGLWLNTALNKAFDKLRIFRPGDKPVMYWAEQAFKHARVAALKSSIDNAYLSQVDVLLSQSDNSVTTSAAVSPADVPVGDIIGKFGRLANRVDYWSKGISDAKILVEAIRELSNLAIIIPHLMEVHSQAGEDAVGREVYERLEAVNETVTFALIAFEALRESRFSDKIILHVSKHSDDPVVDVYVNKDLVNGFISAGGDEQTLAHVGTYIDMKGLGASPVGWAISWVMNRRNDIVSEVLENEFERLEKLRINDRNAVRNAVIDILTPIALSYIDASGRKDLKQSAEVTIRNIALGVTQNDSSFQLDQAIVSFLVSLTGDEQLAAVSSAFLGFTKSEDAVVRKSAPALALAKAAVQTASALM